MRKPLALGTGGLVLFASVVVLMSWWRDSGGGPGLVHAQAEIPLPPWLKPYTIALLVDGQPEGSFEGIAGIETDVQVLEFREGGDPLTRKRPGLVKYGDITLKRGIVHNRGLWDWHKTILDGGFQAKSLTVVILEGPTKEIARYNLYGTWPRAWKGPALIGGASMAVEEITLVVEKVERVGG